MMTRQQFTPFWAHVREMNGIAMRLVEQVPADKFGARPIANMRSVGELLAHMYGMVLRATTVGITTGEIAQPDEAAIVATFKTRDDVLRFCRECWNTSDQAAAKITDAQLAGKVKTPWGFDMPGEMCAGVVLDEFVHHRGQLYCFVRALGAPEVPMMWDFEHNAPEFRAHVTSNA
jgi:uncharacterized damage-inducible protein DinB